MHHAQAIGGAAEFSPPHSQPASQSGSRERPVVHDDSGRSRRAAKLAAAGVANNVAGLLRSSLEFVYHSTSPGAATCQAAHRGTLYLAAYD